MPVRIKICGITRYEDAKVAVSLGVDALGFIFYDKSPRYITPENAGKIINKLPPFISKVGVFVDSHPASIMDIAQKSGIDTVQLQGNETPDIARKLPLSVIKAFSVKPGWDMSVMDKYDVAGFLLDAWASDRRGGTGTTFDWAIAREAVVRHRHIILAGGLNPVNVEEALEAVCPYAVDLNSGLEVSPGIKNPRKMKDAVGIIRSWNR